MLSKRAITLCKMMLQLTIITKKNVCNIRCAKVLWGKSGELKSGGLMSGGLKSAHRGIRERKINEHMTVKKEQMWKHLRMWRGADQGGLDIRNEIVTQTG